MEFIKRPILRVEDNADNLEVIKYLFEMANFEVTACDNLEDCLNEVRKFRFSAIVPDYYLDSQATCSEYLHLSQSWG